ncbi:MAG: septal ring lytic transglycosylase RlpA family protein [Gammaproteobacteria bacterium]
MLTATLALSGCGRTTVRDGPGERAAPQPPIATVPRAEPPSKYGNPESYEVFGKRYYTLKSATGFAEQGIASWYGTKFHGRRTSSGETYDMYRMTAAHKQLPLPTWVEVRNLENNRSVTVRVNDRGPFHENRIIDLSYAAALKLDMADAGTAFVEVRAIDAAGRTVPPARPATRPAVPAAPPAPAPPLYLQVGAFGERVNAERLAERIGRVAPGNVHVQETVSAGRVLYRVRIGPIVSVDMADAMVAALEGAGVTEHHFTTD